jgi:protocatechuate 3,4-dioxygenase beta subunit
LSGAPVVAQIGATTAGIDFALVSLGSITGTVIDRTTGLPVPYADVEVYNSQGFAVGYPDADSNGIYSTGGLEDGIYYVVAYRYNSHVPQLYDGIDCPMSGCNVLSGTPVVVDGFATVSGIDFDLERSSTITGRVTDAQTGLPLYGINVEAWSSDGIYRRTGGSDLSGYYQITGLEPGTFFVATDEYSTYNLTYIDSLYDGIPCPTGPPEGCDPTKGTPVTVVPGVSTRFIDLALERRTSGVAGIVTDEFSGGPVSGAQIDLWDADTGSYVIGAITNVAGTYVVNVDEGSYVVATDNRDGWINQIWDGLQCFGGSAYNGDCDPMTGDVVVVDADRLTEDVDFILAGGGTIFVDGFESGTTVRWSATVP